MKHSGALLCTACKRVKLFAVPQRNCMIDLRTISFVSIVHFLFRRSAPGPLHWMRNKFSVKNIADGRRSLTHLLEARHIAQRRNLLSHAIQRVTHVGFKKVREEDCALMRASRCLAVGVVRSRSRPSGLSLLQLFDSPPVAGTTRKRRFQQVARARATTQLRHNTVPMHFNTHHKPGAQPCLRASPMDSLPRRAHGSELCSSFITHAPTSCLSGGMPQEWSMPPATTPALCHQRC